MYISCALPLSSHTMMMMTMIMMMLIKHSIQWARNFFRYYVVLSLSSRPRWNACVRALLYIWIKSSRTITSSFHRRDQCIPLPASFSCQSFRRSCSCYGVRRRAHLFISNLTSFPPPPKLSKSTLFKLDTFRSNNNKSSLAAQLLSNY